MTDTIKDQKIKKLEELIAVLFEIIGKNEGYFSASLMIKAGKIQADLYSLSSQLAEERKGEPIKEEILKFKDFILEEQKKGNVIVSTFEGLMRIKLDDLLNQPIDGLLYDINRDFGTILTFIEDPKWVNDFACYQVICELSKMLAQSAPDLRGELIAFSKYRENSSPYSAIVNHESYVDEYLQKEK